jgi:hypothetical protein
MGGLFLRAAYNFSVIITRCEYRPGIFLAGNRTTAALQAAGCPARRCPVLPVSRAAGVADTGLEKNQSDSLVTTPGRGTGRAFLYV